MVLSTRIAAVLFWYFTTTSSEFPSEAVTCPADVPAMDHFKPRQFSGDWYLYGAHNANPDRYNMWPTLCGKLYFYTKMSMEKNDITFIYHANVTYQKYYYVKDIRKVPLRGVPITDDGSFTYNNFQFGNAVGVGEAGQFVLLETDYNCWAAFYECVYDLNIEYVGLLLRSFDRACWNVDTESKFTSILNAFHKSFKDIAKVDNSHCDYPPFDPSIL